jgi:hypothetical protein
MIFLNDFHKSNYYQLAKKVNLHSADYERMALFYIIAGNDELFKKRCYIYNFYDNCIKTETLNYESINFCSSSKALIRLGFNLYNGFVDTYTNPLSILGCLDPNNYYIANSAINIRFNRI